MIQKLEVNRQVGGKLGGVLAAVGVLSLVCFAPSAVAACPNEGLRKDQAVTTLPGCLALEMVSPAKKFSQQAFLPSFSREGERVLFKLKAPVGGAPGFQHFGGDSFIAGRGPLGWAIFPTAPPDPAVVAGAARTGNPSTFTPDLGAWTQFAATQAESQSGIAQLFGGDLAGSFRPLSPRLIPIDDSGTITFVVLLEVAGSSEDLSTTVFRVGRASTSYLPDDPRGGSGNEPGEGRNSFLAFLDESGQPALELLARDKDDVVYGGRCGAILGGGEKGTFNQGAISPDGSRIFFSTRPGQPWNEETLEGPVCDLENGMRILERVATPEGPAIEEIAPGGGGPEANGDDLFMGASADGTMVYFTSPRKLATSDLDAEVDPCSPNLGASEGCDLYLYDASKPAGERIVQVSAGEGSDPADVLSSITAVSGDGSHVYFVAQGVLTADANPEGASAVASQPNLYLYEAGTESLSFLATLSPEDAGAMWGTKGTLFGDAYAVPLFGPGLEGGGDGHVLAFASKASLTSEDEDGGFRDVFRYDADADALQLLSSDPEPADEPKDVVVNPAFAEVVEFNFNEMTRWVSEDGQIVAFATDEPLIFGDSDNATNPYVWDAGQLGAVLAPVAEAPAAAPLGGQLAFSTTDALLPRDTDTAPDVYVAREGGGFPEPVPAEICNPLVDGDCQGPLSARPAPIPLPGDGGNVRAPTKCKKGFVKRKGKCVKKPRKRKGKGAGRRRGGSR